jgi:integrase
MTETIQDIRCCQCGSDRINKAGRDSRGQQLFFCRGCFRRFHIKSNITFQSLESLNPIHEIPDGIISVPDEHPFNEFSFTTSKDVGSHKLSVVAKTLNMLPFYNRQSVTEMSQQESQATTVSPKVDEQTFKGQIVTFKFHLAKLNLDEKTINARAKNLGILYQKGAELSSPDSILSVLALNDKWSQGYKANLLQAFKSYAKWMKIPVTIDLPKFRCKNDQGYVPPETNLDQLIAGAGPKTGAFLQLLKETGARTIEASRLQWTDIDPSGFITIRNPAKDGLPRRLRVSEKCIAMLMRQPHDFEYVFGQNPEVITKQMRKNFDWARGHIIGKTSNRDLRKIHLHTFRHYFATRHYLRTQNIRDTQKALGHRSITSTTIYENSLPNQDVETYISKVAWTDEEKIKLLNLGFEYAGLNTTDGHPIMRKKVWN